MKNIKEMALLSTPLSRRRFVKTGAAGGLAITAGGLSLPFHQAVASETQSTINSENLAQAYQRLFIGPYALPAPPWGSVYLDHENVLFGNSTLDLREWMLENGIDIALTQNEPEDHFGLMVMMVAWIAETRPEKLNELLAEHLLPWAYRYLEKLSLQGAFPYYEGLAMLATLTLKSWQSQLNVTPAEKQLFC
ncbi:Tat proofreading chaperone DmsD [Proteus sp. G2672]|uniref:Tat proofreading chaperone DmsD n=1 Tax=Proteus sp. G2672 TaxID=2698884 RepID=UPI00137893DC|nr:Tat proofreading chaperone DmsD [Proteus sp. G2672]NBL76073.1 Tat proofreading chaperone DmsD [Proteus sp. G2672]